MSEHHADPHSAVVSAAHAGHAPPRNKVTPTKKHPDRATGEKSVPGSGSDKSEKTEKKNVSHVPCKFFRQSICQAGDKCSFSHELDAHTQAVCKYYQKGNCKFGAKCALAHITPDGRQVNRKPLKDPKEGISRRKDSKVRHDGVGGTNGGSDTVEFSPPQVRPKTGSASSQASDATMVDSSVQMASRILSKYSGTSIGASAHLPPAQSQSQVLQPPHTSQLSSHAQHQNQHQNQYQQQQQPLQASHGTQPSSPRMNISAKPFTVRSLSSSLPQTPGNQRPLGQLSSLSLGAAGTGLGSTGAISNTGSMLTMSPPLSQPGLQGSAWTSYRSFFEGSAITDDDDDTLEEDLGEEEEGFKEQLVPSTLADLLTPLEYERRNSRTSAQKSGRVFSSPTAGSSPFSFNPRRSSNVSASGGNHELLSSSAPLQDLWGPRPRNQVFSTPMPHDVATPFESRALPKAPIGTQYNHEVPPIDLDGAYQPFQQFNRAIAR